MFLCYNLVNYLTFELYVPVSLGNPLFKSMYLYVGLCEEMYKNVQIMLCRKKIINTPQCNSLINFEIDHFVEMSIIFT